MYSILDILGVEKDYPQQKSSSLPYKEKRNHELSYRGKRV